MPPRVAKWYPLTSVSDGVQQWEFCQKSAQSEQRGLAGSVLPWDGGMGIPGREAKLFHPQSARRNLGLESSILWTDGTQVHAFPVEEVDKGSSCLLCGHTPGEQPLHMGSVRIIRGQELAHVECLSFEKCFHVSCSWHPGALQFSAAAQIPWLCSSPWQGMKTTRHMLNDGRIETRISCTLLERRLEALITREHPWKTCKQISKNHSGDFFSSFFDRLAAWLSFLAKTTFPPTNETGLMNLGVYHSHPNEPKLCTEFYGTVINKSHLFSGRET